MTCFERVAHQSPPTPSSHTPTHALSLSFLHAHRVSRSLFPPCQWAAHTHTHSAPAQPPTEMRSAVGRKKSWRKKRF